MNIAELLFKRQQPTEPPARHALTLHLNAMNSAQAEGARISARVATVQRDITQADVISAELQCLRASIDTAEAAASYSGDDPPDLSAARRRVDELAQSMKSATERARVAANVLPMLQADAAKQIQVLRALRPDTNRLVRDAAIEDMAAHAAELELAETAYRAAHRRVFIAATAADKMSTAMQSGQFVGSGRFAATVEALAKSRPLHPAFYPSASTPEREQAAYLADLRALDQEAEQFLVRLTENP